MRASDYKLHTLHLAEEWADLLTQLEMPKVQLPRVNPTRPSCHKQHGNPSVRVVGSELPTAYSLLGGGRGDRRGARREDVRGMGVCAPRGAV